MIPKFGLVSEQKVPPTPNHRYRGKAKGKLLAMASQTTTQQTPVSVKLVDRLGKPVTPDTPPEWLTDNSDILLLEPSTDGLSCMVKSVGIVGNAKVTVNADGKSGPDVVSIVGTLDFEVTQADAVTVQLTAGAAEEQPAPV